MGSRIVPAAFRRGPGTGWTGRLRNRGLAALSASGATARRWAPALAATVLALVLALNVWDGRQARMQRDLSTDFSFESREIALRLKDRMDVYRQVLRGVRSTLGSTGGLTPQQWERHVADLRLPVNFPGVRAIGWARAIDPGELDVHEQALRSLGVSSYRVWPVEDRAAAQVAVSRIAPGDPVNESLLGRELSRVPALRDALTASAETARSQLSEPWPLPASTAAQPVPHVLLMLPTYRPDRLDPSAAESSERRRQAIAGWVFALFDASTLIGQTVGTLPPTLRLQVHDGEPGAGGSLLFDSGVPPALLANRATPLRVEAPLEIDGRTWHLVFEGFPRTFSGRSGIDTDAVAIGLICVLFAASVVLATRTRLDAQRLQALSQALQASNERFQHLASHDALTGVANRAMFQDRLRGLFDRPPRDRAGFALVYVDLDDFKPVNDTHGHRTGDDLLVAVTRRLQGELRAGDLLARRGGDEFVALLDPVGTRADAEEVAERMRRALAKPFRIDDQGIRISGSLGIALYPEDGSDAEALVHCADHRMYRAKQQGRNRWISSDDTAMCPV
jgi:diguanylate cyclase (GGDEF)-like protein